MRQSIKLEIPPGFVDHGTDSNAAFRWHDGNLVRWDVGVMVPVKGWQALQRSSGGSTVDVTIPYTDESDTPRKSLLWLDNNNEYYMAVGTNDNLYGMDAARVAQDITPSGFTPGATGENLGYGGKDYGRGAYGTERISDGVTAPLATWSMDTWGEYWIGCTSSDENIYIWKLDAVTPTAATPLSAEAGIIGTVPSCKALIVTAERFLFALAADGNPRKITWCDRENYLDWTPTATNEAGDIELQTNGQIRNAVRVKGRTLILTNIDAHVATYQGQPAVYGFRQVRSGCGLVAPNTLVSAAQGAMWMGSNGFFAYDGSQVVEIPCEVEDHVFTNINMGEIRKAHAITNERANEVWWYYPSANSTECNRYVAYDYQEGHWLIGSLSRTCGTDLGVLSDPIWFAPTGEIYRHETGQNRDGEESFAESGPLTHGGGEQMFSPTKLIQDEKVEGQATVTLKSQYYPNDDEREYGPYILGEPTNMRATGRQFRFRINGSDGNDWRLGGMLLQYTVKGKR